jgi:hypothetical protein
MTKIDEIREYLIGELRNTVIKSKDHIVNIDYIDGQKYILRNTLEDFFMTRDEVGQIINETWSE